MKFHWLQSTRGLGALWFNTIYWYGWWDLTPTFAVARRGCRPDKDDARQRWWSRKDDAWLRQEGEGHVSIDHWRFWRVSSRRSFHFPVGWHLPLEWQFCFKGRRDVFPFKNLEIFMRRPLDSREPQKRPRYLYLYGKALWSIWIRKMCNSKPFKYP